MKHFARGIVVLGLVFGSLAYAQGNAANGRQYEAFDNVFTDDARTQITNTDAPWSTIGKFIAPDGSYCTATLVLRDLVVTAAHCIMEDGELVQGNYRFYPQYGNGSGVFSTVNHLWWGTKHPDSERGQDWAFARLNTPLGDRFGWLGMRKMTGEQLLEDRGYNLVGYSSDFRQGSVASGERGCSFKKFNAASGTDLHNCDMSRGASGGAIFYFDDPANPQTSGHIVALNVAEYREGKDSSLVGIPYSDEHANVAVPSSAFFDTFIRIRDGR